LPTGTFPAAGGTAGLPALLGGGVPTAGFFGKFGSFGVGMLQLLLSTSTVRRAPCER
jgi:hypothetical protein